MDLADAKLAQLAEPLLTQKQRVAVAQAGKQDIVRLESALDAIAAAYKLIFAVIGAGWISQEAFLPAVSQSGNAEVTAIVSVMLARQRSSWFHGVPSVYDFSDLM